MTASWQIVVGDAVDRLRTLPDRSVQSCITSPPYFGLRDYGVDGQIGLEATLDEFLGRLLQVFAEVHRVLRDDGTLWLNMGDSYCSAPSGRRDLAREAERSGMDGTFKVPSVERRAASWAGSDRRGTPGIKQKDLIGAPWMLAFALRSSGWFLREDVVWHKPTPMPEPVADRCTRAHEYLFRLTKRPRYFADMDAVREPLAAKTLTTHGGQREPLGGGDLVKADNYAKAVPDRRPRVDAAGDPVGANKRSVWTVRGTPYPEAHFATFPPELVEPMVLMSTSPRACGECGAPRRRIVEISGGSGKSWHSHDDDLRRGQRGGTAARQGWESVRRDHVGWEATCDHDDDTGRCIVLDPFSGAGTTGLVALRHDRSYIGIEINPDYAALSRRRIHDDAPLLNGASELVGARSGGTA